MAEASGLSYKFIGEVERGKANPSVETLERLAKGLGVPLTDLFASPATYPASPRDVLMVREVVESLEGVINRLQQSDTGRKKPLKRHRARERS